MAARAHDRSYAVVAGAVLAHDNYAHEVTESNKRRQEDFETGFLTLALKTFFSLFTVY